MKPEQEVLSNPTSSATLEPRFQPLGLPAWTMTPVQTLLLRKPLQTIPVPMALPLQHPFSKGLQ